MSYLELLKVGQSSLGYCAHSVGRIEESRWDFLLPSLETHEGGPLQEGALMEQTALLAAHPRLESILKLSSYPEKMGELGALLYHVQEGLAVPEKGSLCASLIDLWHQKTSLLKKRHHTLCPEGWHHHFPSGNMDYLLINFSKLICPKGLSRGGAYALLYMLKSTKIAGCFRAEHHEHLVAMCEAFIINPSLAHLMKKKIKATLQRVVDLDMKEEGASIHQACVKALLFDLRQKAGEFNCYITSPLLLIRRERPERVYAALLDCLQEGPELASLIEQNLATSRIFTIEVERLPPIFEQLLGTLIESGGTKSVSQHLGEFDTDKIRRLYYACYQNTLIRLLMTKISFTGESSRFAIDALMRVISPRRAPQPAIKNVREKLEAHVRVFAQDSEQAWSIDDKHMHFRGGIIEGNRSLCDALAAPLYFSFVEEDGSIVITRTFKELRAQLLALLPASSFCNRIRSNALELGLAADARRSMSYYGISQEELIKSGLIFFLQKGGKESFVASQLGSAFTYQEQRVQSIAEILTALSKVVKAHPGRMISISSSGQPCGHSYFMKAWQRADKVDQLIARELTKPAKRFLQKVIPKPVADYIFEELGIDSFSIEGLSYGVFRNRVLELVGEEAKEIIRIAYSQVDEEDLPFEVHIEGGYAYPHQYAEKISKKMMVLETDFQSPDSIERRIREVCGLPQFIDLGDLAYTSDSSCEKPYHCRKVLSFDFGENAPRLMMRERKRIVPCPLEVDSLYYLGTAK